MDIKFYTLWVEILGHTNSPGFYSVSYPQQKLGTPL